MQKAAHNKLANAYSEYIKTFIRETRDSTVAIRMSNRIGILINEASIPKFLEENRITKERFKAIIENPNDEIQVE